MNLLALGLGFPESWLVALLLALETVGFVTEMAHIATWRRRRKAFGKPTILFPRSPHQKPAVVMGMLSLIGAVATLLLTVPTSAGDWLDTGLLALAGPILLAAGLVRTRMSPRGILTLGRSLPWNRVQWYRWSPGRTMLLVFYRASRRWDRERARTKRVGIPVPAEVREEVERLLSECAGEKDLELRQRALVDTPSEDDVRFLQTFDSKFATDTRSAQRFLETSLTLDRWEARRFAEELGRSEPKRRLFGPETRRPRS